MGKTEHFMGRIGRLPGVLALFAATALLLPSATSRGVESPLGIPVGLVAAVVQGRLVTTAMPFLAAGFILLIAALSPL